MKAILLLILFPTLLFASFEQVNQSIVKISNQEKSNRVQTGTGFLVGDDGIVITNHHVINNFKRLMVVDFKGVILPFEEVIGYDRSRDLAILKVRNVSKQTALRIPDSTKLKKGERAIIVRQEGRGKARLVDGKLVGLERNDRLYLSNAIDFGFSGSPVFNEDYELVGVVFAKRTISIAGYGKTRTSDMGGYAVNIESLKKFIEKKSGREYASVEDEKGMVLVASNS